MNQDSGTLGSAPAFLSESLLLIQPMDIFEPFVHGAGHYARKLVRQIACIASKTGAPVEEVWKWFGDLASETGGKNALIFYGKAVYGRGGSAPSDIDIMYLMGSRDAIPKPLWRGMRPPFIHDTLLVDGSRVEDIDGWRRFSVVNGLLAYPLSSIGRVAKKDCEGRKLVQESGFFKGGIGELLTYAASKVIEGKEAEYFAQGESGILENFARAFNYEGPDGPKKARSFFSGTTTWGLSGLMTSTTRSGRRSMSGWMTEKWFRSRKLP